MPTPFQAEEEAGIPKERYRPAKIFGKLREGDVLANRGRKVVYGITDLDVTEVPDSRQQHGGSRRRTSSSIFTLDGI